MFVAASSLCDGLQETIAALQSRLSAIVGATHAQDRGNDVCNWQEGVSCKAGDCERVFSIGLVVRAFASLHNAAANDADLGYTDLEDTHEMFEAVGVRTQELQDQLGDCVLEVGKQMLGPAAAPETVEIQKKLSVFITRGDVLIKNWITKLAKSWFQKLSEELKQSATSIKATFLLGICLARIVQPVTFVFSFAVLSHLF
jgi:hypothetical protein